MAEAKMKKRLAGDASPIRRPCLDWSRQAPLEFEMDRL